MMSYGPTNPCRKTKLCTHDNTPPGQYWEPECAEHDYPTLHRDYLSYPSIHPDTEKQQQGHRKNQPDHVRLEAPLLSWCSHVGLKTILLLDSNLPALLRSFPQPWNRFGFWNSCFSNCSSATYGISLTKQKLVITKLHNIHKFQSRIITNFRHVLLFTITAIVQYTINSFSKVCTCILYNLDKKSKEKLDDIIC